MGVDDKTEICHNGCGNCWVPSYRCPKCGDNLCDVCHLHDQPRGECDKCPECLECCSSIIDLYRFTGAER